MSEELNGNNIEENLHLDNFLDFNKQFILNEEREEGYHTVSFERNITSLISSGLFFGFRIHKNGKKIQITPIYKHIDKETIDNVDFTDFIANVDLLRRGNNLNSNDSIYFKFKTNSLGGDMEDTEENIKIKVIKVL